MHMCAEDFFGPSPSTDVYALLRVYIKGRCCRHSRCRHTTTSVMSSFSVAAKIPSTTTTTGQRRRLVKLRCSSSSSSSPYYVENVLDENALGIIREEMRGKTVAARLKAEKASFAKNRRCASLSPIGPSYRDVLSSAKTIRKLREITGEPTLTLGDFPAELRVCDVGSEMDWHVDPELYDPPQWECVFTIDNDSDSVTEWELEEDDVHVHTRTTWTAPGSALIFRAGGVKRHRVKPSTFGERVIVKALYVCEKRVKTEAFADALDTAPWRR